MARSNSRILAKPVTGVILLAACLFASSNVAAQTTTGADDKSWTGAACVPGAGITWGWMKILPSAIINDTDNARYIACSITVDAEQTWQNAENNGGTDSGLGYLALQFSFVGAASATVTCTAQVVDFYTGTIIETVSGSVAGTAGDSTVFLYLPALYQGDGNTAAVGFNCLLPSKVRLNVINLEEYADTHQPTVAP